MQHRLQISLHITQQSCIPTMKTDRNPRQLHVVATELQESLFIPHWNEWKAFSIRKCETHLQEHVCTAHKVDYFCKLKSTKEVNTAPGLCFVVSLNQRFTAQKLHICKLLYNVTHGIIGAALHKAADTLVWTHVARVYVCISIYLSRCVSHFSLFLLAAQITCDSHDTLKEEGNR